MIKISSGIHGRPFQSWDDVNGSGNPNTGYCTHGSVLFPTWHRPYLAVYEVCSRLFLPNSLD